MTGISQEKASNDVVVCSFCVLAYLGNVTLFPRTPSILRTAWLGHPVVILNLLHCAGVYLTAPEARRVLSSYEGRAGAAQQTLTDIGGLRGRIVILVPCEYEVKRMVRRARRATITTRNVGGE